MQDGKRSRSSSRSKWLEKLEIPHQHEQTPLRHTNLGVQSVTKLGHAARNLVKVNRLTSSIALDNVKGHDDSVALCNDADRSIDMTGQGEGRLLIVIVLVGLIPKK